jgi:hypothetical protein
VPSDHLAEFQPQHDPRPRVGTPNPAAPPAAAHAFLLGVQATAGNRAAQLVVQRRWEMKYSLAGVSKANQQAARGGRQFFQTVGMTTVGLRADINGTKVGAGNAAGGQHAEDELITELNRLGNDQITATAGGQPRTAGAAAVLAPGNNNRLHIRKLDATPCTSTARTVWVAPRRKTKRRVKSKAGGFVVKKSWAPDRRKGAVRIPIPVVTSQKGALPGCTERLIDLKRNGITVGGQTFGFSHIAIEANNLYQGGPAKVGGHHIAVNERRAASQQAFAQILAEPGMSIAITAGYIGRGKGR